MRHTVCSSSLVAFAIAVGGQVTFAADAGTAFTYQGYLERGSPPAPVDDICALRFSLWDAASLSEGSQVGTSPQEFDAVSIERGLFTVTIDFGGDAMNGMARWLMIEVMCPGDPPFFQSLDPRVALTPAPYALRATEGVGPPGVLSVTPEGNVGIGTQSPAQKLDVVGVIHSSDGISTGNTITVCSPTAGSPQRWISSDDFMEFYVDDPNTATPCSTLAGADRALHLEKGGADPASVNLIGGNVSNTVRGGVDGATISGGGRTLAPNMIHNDYGTIGGGYGNEAGNPASVSPSQYTNITIGGGFGNIARAYGDVISGGWRNATNIPTPGAGHCTIAGGIENTADGTGSSIGGGQINKVTGNSSTIAGGVYNAITADNATVSGGESNKASKPHASIGGGFGNIADADGATIGGGELNNVRDGHGTVGGGSGNVSDGHAATVAGGDGNMAEADFTAIAGGAANTVTDVYGVIGGGQGNQAGDPADGDPTLQPYATVSGGSGNIAGWAATVAGGESNTANAYTAAVGGGFQNTASGVHATVPGGALNTASGDLSFAAGHEAAAIHDGTFVWSDYSGPGISSTAANQFLIRAAGGVGIGTNNPSNATLHVDRVFPTTWNTGGAAARITFSDLQPDQPTAASYGLDVLSTTRVNKGGQIGVSGVTSFNYGGVQNGIATGRLGQSSGFSGNGAMIGVLGGSSVTALRNIGASTSFGVGGHFSAAPPSAPLSLDGTGAYYVGGVYATVGGTQPINGSAGTGVVAAVIGRDLNPVTSTVPHYAGYFEGNVHATGLITNSDRSAKQNFKSVDPYEILARVAQLEITQWNFKHDGPEVDHMGPMAQDFHAAFGLGSTEKGIATVDADGVALAAIQGLHDLVEEKDCRIGELEDQNRQLEARLSAIERILSANGGGK